jgi:hypothetical protein
VARGMRRRLGQLAFVALLLAAGLAPLAPSSRERAAPVADFPGWPTTFEGRMLTPVEAAPEDSFFARDFPGRIARFTDGRRQIVVRWVSEPTRRLHPAAHCFAGTGYAITPLPLRHAADGALMGCFAARKGATRLRVCEILRDAAGRSWADVSAWYWSALLSPARGAWWSYVIVEPSLDPGANGDAVAYSERR